MLYKKVQKGMGGTCKQRDLADTARWGQPFLHHTYLHHLTRLDHRHNFSPYSYLIYLSLFPNSSAATLAADSTVGRCLSGVTTFLRHPLTSFLPQASLVLGAGMMTLRTGLGFAMFFQTAAFVVFNKVCTSQVCLAPISTRRAASRVTPT
jgi:phosphatidylinositol glycan class M